MHHACRSILSIDHEDACPDALRTDGPAIPVRPCDLSFERPCMSSPIRASSTAVDPLTFPRRRAHPHRCVFAFLAMLPVCACVFAAEPPDESPQSVAAADERTAAYLQLTTVAQRHPRFNSPYAGANSLGAFGRTEETTDITAYLGLRLWRGAEAWVNPEVDQGFGFDRTVGAAGFPSGEAYKVGANAPYVRVPRLFVRQTIPLGGDAVAVDATANQLRGATSANNLTLTVGKFSVVDVFDTNRYAHDPRGDFLNWSVIDAGPFDYAADAWGFTYGASAELAIGDWTTRLGYFQLSRQPNGKIVAADFSQSSSVAEIERRKQWLGRPGKIKLLAFVNRASMGRYADAVSLASANGVTPDIALVRRKASRGGVSLNIEQEVADHLGLFVRASGNDGGKEAYEFTEINRSVSTGLSFGGDRWHRPDDVFGVAAVVNALSRPARAYFAAGGLGILIGDGRLNYGSEQIVETYYAWHVNRFVIISADYQHIDRPAYNRDRGPVSVYTLRLHLQS